MTALQSADIAIIGGGIIGMAIAYELSRHSEAGKIIVLEKSLPATGTSGGSGGVICLHDMGELYACFTLLGYARVRALQQEHQFNFRTWGSMSVFYEPDDFPPPPNAYYQRFGGGGGIYEHEVLDTDLLFRRFPWIKPTAEGKKGEKRTVSGAILYPSQGFIDPYELVSLYERLATATGRVEIHRNTPVLQIRTQDQQICEVVTRRGTWRVGTVINAAGPWGAKVAALAGCDLPLTPQRIQVCVATGYEDQMGEVPLMGIPESACADGEHVWCRGEIGGTLIFGQHHHTPREGYTADPDFVNRINDEPYPEVVGGAYRRYWKMPHSVFLNGWCCVYGMTEDGFPIISRDTQINNFYHAVGLNGHGITCHAAVAQALTQLVLYQKTSLDMTELLGQPVQLDVSVLGMDRFVNGKLLDFELRQQYLK